MKAATVQMAKDGDRAQAGGFRAPGLFWHFLKEQVKRPFYAVYQRRLIAKSRSWKLPHHIGIIMDGNRRYARQSGLLDVNEGHARGAEKLQEVLRWCCEFDIPVVTVWGLSLDNFNRDAAEVKGLLDLFESKFRELVHHEDVHHHQIKVRYIGNHERLPGSLQKAILAAEEATAHYDKLILNIAVAYSGREEITKAFQNYLLDQVGKGRPFEDVTKNLASTAIEPYLYTAGQPEPDLIIRTSGELRLGGFLMWQSAYSEYYFCNAYWPAFRKIDFLRALRSYSQRQCRMGK
jgi:short-chain Z-isoprenyl diphosphate synthase